MPANSRRPAVATCEECESAFVVPWQRGPIPRVCGPDCRRVRTVRLNREGRRRQYAKELNRLLTNPGGVENGKAAPADSP